MMGKKNRRHSLFLWLGILAVLLAASGCATRESTLALQPGRQLLAPSAAGVRPLVRLDLFTEEGGVARSEIGVHVMRSERQILKVEEGELARALRRMISQQLTARNIPYSYGEELPVGLGPGERVASSAVPMVIDGSISRLWLEVKSGVLHSNYKIELVVATRLHLGAEKKVISRSVHVNEEMVKLTSWPDEMEKFLDSSLEEAASQIVQKIVEQAEAGLRSSSTTIPRSLQ
jgi:hypothetical protein